MFEPAHREWRFYVADMIGFAEKVLAYTEGFDQARFVANSLNYDATVRNLELIGEAATKISTHGIKMLRHTLRYRHVGDSIGRH
jgi:uncharacterized protein with HEPN domain